MNLKIVSSDSAVFKSLKTTQQALNEQPLQNWKSDCNKFENIDEVERKRETVY